MLPALLVTAMTLAAPAAGLDPGARADVTLLVDGHPVRVRGDASEEGAFLRVDSEAGWQFVDVRSECVPDLDGDCDTVVNCQEGTANCYIMRRPRPPFPCVIRPDGSMLCDFNGTDPNQTEPPEPQPIFPTPPLPGCEDALSEAACAVAPHPGDDAAAACRRLVADAVCDGPPGMPEAPAPPSSAEEACLRHFHRSLCQHVPR